MNPDHFQRAEQLFHEALALAPATRDHYVQQAVNGDVELGAQVHRMIRFAERTSATSGLLDDHMLSHTQADDNADQRLIGVTVGRFQIDELLGRGGFGCVYRAQQMQPIQRTVALKILHRGMDSQQVLARFDAERQALAVMEHPNIARVLDAGRTQPEFGSRPYFAMELVSGAPITMYCDEHHLSTNARLELFVTVCQAVQHAHQKGIIHRDLKPSNILVSEIDGVATPKVIDFGIAKATQQASVNQAVTEVQQLLGTPQYMSPEQADMDVHNIDTRSDIYSLGVVLYELLTGSTPMDSQALRQVSFSQMQRMIREQAIERPSTRITRVNESASKVAQTHGSDIASLRRKLRGDLDWIALKALDHDRDRRYPSASALANDIRRHLRHEPVQAGPPSTAYRMRKFVRRHRVAVAAAALVLLALIGGAVGTTLAMVRANDAADQALAINQFMSEVLTEANPDQSGADVRLADVLRRASITVSQRFAGHPEIELQVRNLLGGVFLNLGLQKDSTQELRQAAALADAVFGPDDRRTLYHQFRHLQAHVFAENAREAEKSLAALAPRVERVAGVNDPLAIELEMFRGAILKLRGRNDESEALLRQVYARAIAAGSDDTLTIRVLDNLIISLRTRLNLSNFNPQAMDEVDQLARQMETLAERSHGKESMLTIRARVIRADCMLRRGDAAGATQTCREVLAVSEHRLGRCHAQRHIAMALLAEAMNAQGNAAGAADLYLEIIQCVREREQSSLNLAVRLSGALPYLERAGRWAEGEALAREYAALLRDLGGGHGDMLYWADLYVAQFVSLQGRLDEAESLMQAMLKREKEAESPQSHARLHRCYGSHLARRGLYEEAEASLNAAVDHLGDIRQGTTRHYPDDVITEFIALYEAWGKPEKVPHYQALREEALHGVAAAE